MDDTVQVAVENCVHYLLHDSAGDFLIEIISLLNHAKDIATFTELTDQIVVLRVGIDLVDPNDMRMVNIP